MSEPNYERQIELLRERGIAPVKPLPGTPVRALILFAIVAATAVAMGFGAGAKGWRALDAAQRLELVIPLLFAGLWIAADLAARMAPGSRIRTPSIVPAAVAFALLATLPFALAPLRPMKLFYPACLAFTTAAVAVSGLLVSRWLRRGLFTAPGAGLLTASAVAFAGFAAVSIFCPVVEGGHILTSHVLPALVVGAVAGRYLPLTE